MKKLFSISLLALLLVSAHAAVSDIENWECANMFTTRSELHQGSVSSMRSFFGRYEISYTDFNSETSEVPFTITRYDGVQESPVLIPGQIVELFDGSIIFAFDRLSVTDGSKLWISATL